MKTTKIWKGIERKTKIPKTAGLINCHSFSVDLTQPQRRQTSG